MSNQQEKEKPLLTEQSTLCDVLAHFPSKAALGRKLRGPKGKPLTRQALNGMKKDEPLPRVHYLTLRYETCSDLYPVEGATA